MDEVLAWCGFLGAWSLVSRWWWMLPPVRLWLQRRRMARHRQAVIDAMPDEDLERFTRYVNTAAGWLMVAGGGLLLAARETWGLVEQHQWPAPLFGVIVLVMATVSISYAVGRRAHSDRALEGRRAAADQRVRASDDPNGP